MIFLEDIEVDPSSFITITKEDDNDPESPLTALLWSPDEEGNEQEPDVLAWTQVGQDPKWFFWLVQNAAQRLGLRFQNDSSVEVEL